MFTDEKTNSFLNTIRKSAERERRQILAEIESNKAAAIKDAENQGIKDSCALVQKEQAKIISDIARETASVEAECKKELLRKRATIINAVFEKAESKLLDFKRTEEYTQFLSKAAHDASEKYPQKCCIVQMRSDDSVHAKMITEIIKNCTVEYTDSIKIGGIIVHFINDNIMLDQTLDTCLDAEKERFVSASELAIV